jgi:NADPH:quinone reductase-like Zn-dependent oxidoreductase
VTGLKVGQEVYGITMLGAYAEKVVVSASRVRPVPKGMSLVDVRTASRVRGGSATNVEAIVER